MPASPPVPVGSQPRPSAGSGPLDAGPSGVSFTFDELLAATGLTPGQARELEQYGLIEAGEVAGDPIYGDDAVVVARKAAVFFRHGAEPRHLRMFKVAADREAGFFEQIILPLLKQRNPAAKQQAIENLNELAQLGEALHAAFLAPRCASTSAADPRRFSPATRRPVAVGSGNGRDGAPRTAGGASEQHPHRPAPRARGPGPRPADLHRGAEATAIAFALEDVATPRPLTHDLLKDLLEALGALLVSVSVTELRSGTFYADLELSTAAGTQKVSCRPSDGIALALRTGAPIFASEAVLDEAGQIPRARRARGEPGAGRRGVQGLHRARRTPRTSPPSSTCRRSFDDRR